MSSRLATSAARISGRSKTIEYTECKVPTAPDNFVERFKSASGKKEDLSNEFVIDVFPDFTETLMYIFFFVSTIATEMDARNHAKITPPTIVMYCLTIVYAHWLICDLEFRLSPSPAARTYADEQWKKEYLAEILALPVPDFLEPIIKKFMPTTTDSRSNVQYCPSAAGFDINHFLGRFYPVNMFSVLHDLTSRLASNSDPNLVHHKMLQTSVATIANLTPNRASFELRIANLLGARKNGNVYSELDSRFSQFFKSIFNPVLFRDAQRRSSLAPVNLEKTEFNSKFLNPYDLLLAATEHNFSEQLVIYRTISAAFKGSVKCPGDLASFYSSVSGSDILVHGYSEYPLPHWYGGVIDTVDSAHLKDDLEIEQPRQRATNIGFLRAGNHPLNTTPDVFTAPTGRCTVTPADAVIVTSPDEAWNLLTTATIDDADKTPHRVNDYVNFDPKRHIFPSVFVYHPLHDSIDAWKATCFGLVIRSMEIDGSVIELPNTQAPLGVENSYFANSAIPYRYVYPATSFYTHATKDWPICLTRTVTDQGNFKTANLTRDFSRIMLYRVSAAQVITKRPSWMPGFTQGINNIFIQKDQSFYGMKTATVNERTNATYDDYPNTRKQRLLVWSPYTYTPVAEPRRYGKSPTRSDRSYFLVNLRTIFGSDAQMVQLKDGKETMPMA